MKRFLSEKTYKGIALICSIFLIIHLFSITFDLKNNYLNPLKKISVKKINFEKKLHIHTKIQKKITRAIPYKSILLRNNKQSQEPYDLKINNLFFLLEKEEKEWQRYKPNLKQLFGKPKIQIHPIYTDNNLITIKLQNIDSNKIIKKNSISFFSSYQMVRQ